MQQPNQSPPGCNPYAVNNKGIAHLLLILLLVAGLSVVGMFLFKMVSGGGLDVMGARIAANETHCNIVSPSSVVCSGDFEKQDCSMYVVGRGTVSGKRCVAIRAETWGPWNFPDCQLSNPTVTNPSKCNGSSPDCIRVSSRGVKQGGLRCTDLWGPWNYPDCSRNGGACSSGQYLHDCTRRSASGELDRGSRCVNTPDAACRESDACAPNVNNPKPCCSGFKSESCSLSPYTGNNGTRCVRDSSSNTCTPASGACISRSSFVRCCSGTPQDCNPGGTTVKCVTSNQTTPVCGNGKLEAVEQCDAGGSNALCPALCSTTCRLNNCTTPPPATVCGNGVIERGEQCDTGSSNGVCPGYCSSSCRISPCYANNPASVCGNGKVERGEACDAGSSNGSCPARCNSSCQVNSCGSGTPLPQARCGNGVQEGGEQCDTGSGNASCPSPCSTSCSLNSCGGGGGGTTPPPSSTCTTCVTASGSFKTMDGKPVNGAAVIVYLGDGSTAGTTKTDASGNFSLRFDKKGSTFALRSVSTSYKPTKTSYPECTGTSAVGYENCWFRPQLMSGVDFVATQPQDQPQAPKVYKAPTAELAQVSAASTVNKGDTVSTVVYAKSEHSRIKKVTLYLNPAYSTSPRCQSEAIGALELYGLKDRWVKVGEKVYSDTEAVASGFTTINWSTVSNYGVAVPCSLQDGTNQYDTCKNSSYYLTVNVEDMGGVVSSSGTAIVAKNPDIRVMRCTGNPLGPTACGSTFYDASCGNKSWSRIDIRPTAMDTPVPAVRNATIRAMGTPAGGVYPLMILKSGTTEIKRWFVTGQFADYVADVGKTPVSDLYVHFVNDSETDGSRNLRVDYMKLGDAVYQSEASTTMSLGSWTTDTRCGVGYKLSEWLHCNGYFIYKDSQLR